MNESWLSQYPTSHAELTEHLAAPVAEWPKFAQSTSIMCIGSRFSFSLARRLAGHKYPVLPGRGAAYLMRGRTLLAPAFVQELDWAHTEPLAAREVWSVDGRLLDPFRRGVVWKSRDQIEADREQYARALRESVGQTNLLVWTLGQTEAWYGQGSIYAHTPPADVRERPNVYWLNVGYAAQVAALGEALSFFTRARVVLTVSPVPLRRTFSGMPAIAAAGQAKGVLRAAAAAVVGRENVDYFPAYEYVNSLGFEARRGDGRHVRLRVVDMVVGAFLARYMEQ